MPKRTYKLLRFDGGINNDADPRDIGDNQFAELQNVAVDQMGKIIVLGDIKTTRKSLTGAITGAGNGLFACSTDHDGLLDGTIAEPGQTYYLTENGDTIQGIGDDGESSSIACTIGSAGPTMYYVDGALRIADADMGGGTVPVWRGFVPGKTLMPQAATHSIKVLSNTWATQNAEIAGAFPTFSYTGTTICKNAMMLNVVYGDHGPGGEEKYSFNLDANTQTEDGDYNGVNAKAISTLNWGFALEFAEKSGDGNAIANGTGTWMPATTTRYKFYITTMHDDHNQESLPQLLRMWGTAQVSGDGDGFHGKTVETEISFTTGDSAVIGENVAVYFSPKFKLLASSAGNYNFGAATTGETGANGNPRISGCRIYWASNEDGYSSLWQLFDAKWAQGVKVIGVDGGGGGSSGYSPWKDADGYSTGYSTVALDVDNVWTNPPRFLQYDVLNGHSSTDVIKVDAFKSAVLANRRVYLGNVKQDGIIHGDRMLKSPVNQFDKFPSINNIDVATHDGDDIIVLIEYADRILQFKKNTCYIINVSGGTEFLEAEHKFKGITNAGAACRTDYGVAWCNQNGCYLYDGQAVTDLLEDQGMRKINPSTWSTFIGTANYHRIGFNPFKRQLIILQGTTADDAYIFDIITKSWTFSSSMVADGDTGSNFINDPVDGSLLIFDDGGNTIDKWVDTPTASPSIIIKTKDIDFGEPAVRKKIYKVYVTYKGNGTSVTPEYNTNGGATDFGFVAGFSNVAVWTRLELVPDDTDEAKSVYSFQLKLTGTAGTDFAINDISIIHRAKSIK